MSQSRGSSVSQGLPRVPSNWNPTQVMPDPSSSPLASHPLRSPMLVTDQLLSKPPQVSTSQKTINPSESPPRQALPNPSSQSSSTHSDQLYRNSPLPNLASAIDLDKAQPLNPAATFDSFTHTMIPHFASATSTPEALKIFQNLFRRFISERKVGSWQLNHEKLLEFCGIRETSDSSTFDYVCSLFARSHELDVREWLLAAATSLDGPAIESHIQFGFGLFAVPAYGLDEAGLRGLLRGLFARKGGITEGELKARAAILMGSNTHGGLSLRALIKAVESKITKTWLTIAPPYKEPVVAPAVVGRGTRPTTSSPGRRSLLDYERIEIVLEDLEAGRLGRGPSAFASPAATTRLEEQRKADKDDRNSGDRSSRSSGSSSGLSSTRVPKQQTNQEQPPQLHALSSATIFSSRLHTPGRHPHHDYEMHAGSAHTPPESPRVQGRYCDHPQHEFFIQRLSHRVLSVPTKLGVGLIVVLGSAGCVVLLIVVRKMSSFVALTALIDACAAFCGFAALSAIISLILQRVLNVEEEEEVRRREQEGMV